MPEKCACGTRLSTPQALRTGKCKRCTTVTEAARTVINRRKGALRDLEKQ